MPETTPIRRARPEDQARLGQLWTALLEEQAALDPRFEIAGDAPQRWHNDFRVWLGDETYRLFVAEQSGDVVGFASAERWGPPPIYRDTAEVYLNELYVEPGARRQGAGAQLVQAVRRWAASLGAQRIRLRMLAGNADARAFWEGQQARELIRTLAIELDAGSDDPAETSTPRRIGF